MGSTGTLKELVMKLTKTATHEFNTPRGNLSISLSIYWMDVVEADASGYTDSGWMIEGMIDGIPCGSFFSTGNLGSDYWGAETVHAARRLVVEHLDIPGYDDWKVTEVGK
jgi:hypothetical protein